MIRDAVMLYVPSDPTVSVCTQNSLNWGYLAHRNDYFAFPSGVIDPVQVPDHEGFSLEGLFDFIRTGKVKVTRTPRFAEYVLLDLKRPWFINDQGCTRETGDVGRLAVGELETLHLADPGPLLWGECDQQEIRTEFLEVIRRMQEQGMYQLVLERDGFLIFKRRDLSGMNKSLVQTGKRFTA